MLLVITPIPMHVHFGHLIQETWLNLALVLKKEKKLRELDPMARVMLMAVLVS